MSRTCDHGKSWIIAQLRMENVEPDSDGGGDDPQKIKHPNYHRRILVSRYPISTPVMKIYLKMPITSITLSDAPGAFKDLQSKWPEIVTKTSELMPIRSTRCGKKHTLTAVGDLVCSNCKPTVVSIRKYTGCLKKYCPPLPMLLASILVTLNNWKQCLYGHQVLSLGD